MTSRDKRSPLPWVVAIIVAAAGGFAGARLTSVPTRPDAHEAPLTQEPEAAPPADQLTMTSDAQRSAGIGIESVSAGGLTAEVVALGQVTVPPGGKALVTARIDGTVIQLSKRTGDVVRAGESLAIVESRDAAQLAADREAAKARAALAQKSLARERFLFEQKVSPRMDLEQAEAEAIAAAAEARRAEAAAVAAQVSADGHSVAVTSPIAGVVGVERASLGAFVQGDTVLFRITDPMALQVEAAVPPADLARVAAGDRAVVELFDGSSVEGRIRALTAVLSDETRAATAIIDVSGGALRAGLGVRVRILPARAALGAAVVVPEDALQTLEGRDVVFVQTPSGFKARPVTVSRRSAGRVELASGLDAGVTIATRNAFLLKAELAKGAGEEE